MHQLEIAIASNDVIACTQLAATLKGHLYVDERDKGKVPFKALMTCVTDDLRPLREAGDVGVYVICRRVIKPGSANIYCLFPLSHHPQKTHEESDAHWRDVHAPLALVHHPYMTHYVQLSVVAVLDGLDVDGFALCGFDNNDDLRHRFYRDEESVKVIANDIRNFADLSRSPGRLIATPTHP